MLSYVLFLEVCWFFHWAPQHDNHAGLAMLWSCAKGRAPGQTCQLKPLMWSPVEFSKRKFGGSNTLKTRASQVWDGVFFFGNLQIERKQRENQAGFSKHRTIWDSNLLKHRTLPTSFQLCPDFELIHLQNHAKSRSKIELGSCFHP